MAPANLADFTPLQFSASGSDDLIQEYVVRPSARRDLYQAPRYTLRERVEASRTSWQGKLTEALRQRQERAAIRHIAALSNTPSAYDAVSVVRYQATVRPPSRLASLTVAPKRNMVLACSLLATALPLGWAISAPHHASQPAPAVATVATAAMIASQNLDAKLPEITAQVKGASLERGKRATDLTYVAKAGDTFTSVGARFGLTGRTVRLVNELPLGYRLRAGQKLVVTPIDGAYHRVRQGENLGAISKRYAVAQPALVAANPGLKADKLALNQRVFVPGATALRYPSAPREESTRGLRRGPMFERLTASRSLVGRFGARVGQLFSPTNGTFSSPFGVRGHSFHPGMDISNYVGTPIRAAKAGVVKSSGWNGAYGMAVDIDHGGGVVTRYGHCSKLLVKAGQTVEAGQLIAQMGSTGRSTGPHLHFEVRIQDRAVNPANFL